MSMLVVLATPQNDPAPLFAPEAGSRIPNTPGKDKQSKNTSVSSHVLAYAAKAAQGLTYASVGNEGVGKLQTAIEHKVSIAQGLWRTSSAFAWLRMYAKS